jgi:glycosyltransferase involved in cell wall biosynthesis
MVEQGFHQVIVVDYDCPQGTAAWIQANQPHVTAIKISDQPLFNVSKARNIGAEHSCGDMLCFVDADIEIGGEFLGWFKRRFSKEHFHLLEPQTLADHNQHVKALYGLVICTKQQFEAVGGYDDVIAGWGGEDLDFYWRLKRAGYRAKLFPLGIIDNIISHDDALRTTYHSLDKETSDLAAGYYLAAKYKLDTLIPMMNASRELRQKIYSQAIAGCQQDDIKFDVSLDPNDRIISFSISRAEMLHVKRMIYKDIKRSTSPKRRRIRRVAWHILNVVRGFQERSAR